MAGGAVFGTGTWLTRRPLRERPAGIALPGTVTAVVDAPVTRVLLRVAGLLAAALVLGLLVAVPADPDVNPAPRLVLVVVWAGLIPVSLVAPGTWRAVSPLRTLSRLLAWFVGEEGARPLPRGLGWWPAAASLVAFSLVEGPLRGDPTALLIFLVAYGLGHLGATAVYGPGWLARAEAFEVLAAVVGRLSPVARGDDGRFRLGSPLARLTAPVPPGTVAVVGVLVGAALADFVRDQPAWRGGTLAAVGVLAGATLLATGLAAIAARPRPLTPALLPVVTGYLLAHYFAVLLIEGQVALTQLAAALRGQQLVIAVRYELLPGPLAAGAQLLGFLLPHLVAAAVGVRIARARYQAARVSSVIAPLLGVLALSAVGGTALRYAAG